MALGHLNYSDMQNLRLTVPPDKCDLCTKAKFTRPPFTTRHTTRVHLPGQLLAFDTGGPIKPTCLDGGVYYLTCTDMFTGFGYTTIMATKDEATDLIMHYCKRVFNKFGRHPEAIHSDGEYTSNELKAYCFNNGIHHEFTHTGSPQQNGKAERRNRTYFNGVRANLMQSMLPLTFWSEALLHITHTCNFHPRKDKNWKTPYELWHGSAPDLRTLHSFGELAFVHMHPVNKLLPRSRQMIFLGYCLDKSGYRFWDPSEFKVVESRDCTFSGRIDENLNRSIGSQPKDSDWLELDFPVDDVDIANNEANDPPFVTPDSSRASTPSSGGDSSASSPIAHRTRSKAVAAIASFLAYPTSFALVTASTRKPLPPDPRNYKEAMASPHAAEWQAAMEAEIASLKAASTWKLVKRPPARKMIGCRWVYRTKYNQHGNVVKRKARLTAKGYTQVRGVDYDDTFAPVASQNSLRIVLTFAASNDWEIDQADVESAFVRATMDGNIIYMEQPEGFNENIGLVCLLLRPLYGLKQSPKLWNDELDKALRKAGLIPTGTDPCVYTFKQSGKLVALVSVYVDDLLICGNRNIVNKIKDHIASLFPTKDLGPVRCILGYEVDRDRKNRTLILHQHGYIMSMLKQFNMEHCKPANCPMDTTLKLTSEMQPANAQEEQEMRNIPYRSLVGALLYAATGTRPDIAAPVSILCRFNQNPGLAHWKAAKQVLRYLKGTSALGVRLGGDFAELKAIGYVDADWAGDVDSRKSTSGLIFMINNAPVTWKSKLQNTPALSSMEAELMALTKANQEALWIRKLFAELGCPLLEATTICEDNQSCIAYVYGTKVSQQSKHIGVRHSFVKHYLDNGEIELKYVPTENMIADMLTKPLPPLKLIKHRQAIMDSANA